MKGEIYGDRLMREKVKMNIGRQIESRVTR